MPAGFAAGGGGALASRGGQITPSQPAFLHLKSGARGLRLFSRLSHMSPPHLGQAGALVSGSGPTVFATYPTPEAAAEAARAIPGAVVAQPVTAAFAEVREA